ncbi:MAG: hypothetical protein P8N94_12110 [Gammaproteobacteria bacterium]|nr:hypothetical protein [Gammaproteobacteria bacterium]MDG2338704.1 hypothetical protein [Gammaproteobacteria bacterium]
MTAIFIEQSVHLSQQYDAGYLVRIGLRIVDSKLIGYGVIA